MNPTEIKKRIKQLEHLIGQPHQSASVKDDLQREVLRLQTQFKDIKRCLFGTTFAERN